MKKQIEDFNRLIESSIFDLNIHKSIAIECNLDSVIINLFQKTSELIESLLKITDVGNLKINYLNQFQANIQNIINNLPYRGHKDINFLQNQNKVQIALNLENKRDVIQQQYDSIKFNLDFFQKISFFNNNVVAIGANGSGKTSLSNNLKTYLPKNGVVISALRVLIVPTFSGISNMSKTSEKLANTQLADKTYKTTYLTENSGNSYHILTSIGDEFRILLDNLLAERSTIRNQFCDALKNGSKNTNVPISNLDKALVIWNSLIEHRTIDCNDGINITLSAKDIDSYPAYQMSEGEKVILYLIAQVLQAPDSGFIIVDEPEMYLHKTILKKLWDILEKERQDCIFIYLTHDLDFATSRATAKKIWIRSFVFPDKWEIENIPENELPESLLLELLGSRKNILFCEGQKGSIDEKIYNLLFPQYTITPVGNCFQVINHTKAFNKIPNISIKAYGLIDSDHHSNERLSALKSDNIFNFCMAEAENLLLDEKFLLKLASNLLMGVGEVNKIKTDVIKQFENELEQQASNYISAKIDYYFKDTNVVKGNDLTHVKSNFSKFTSEIKVDDWYQQRLKFVQELIQKKDYAKIIAIYNNKGLRKNAERNLRISDFTERALKLMQFDSGTHTDLKAHFPVELTK